MIHWRVTARAQQQRLLGIEVKGKDGVNVRTVTPVWVVNVFTPYFLLSNPHVKAHT